MTIQCKLSRKRTTNWLPMSFVWQANASNAEFFSVTNTIFLIRAIWDLCLVIVLRDFLCQILQNDNRGCQLLSIIKSGCTSLGRLCWTLKSTVKFGAVRLLCPTSAAMMTFIGKSRATSLLLLLTNHKYHSAYKGGRLSIENTPGAV